VRGVLSDEEARVPAARADEDHNAAEARSAIGGDASPAIITYIAMNVPHQAVSSSTTLILST